MICQEHLSHPAEGGEGVSPLPPRQFVTCDKMLPLVVPLSASLYVVHIVTHDVTILTHSHYSDHVIRV